MAKIIDISDRLAFNEDPALVINGEKFTVNSNAEAVLKIMGAFDGKDEARAVRTALGELFSPEDLERLLKIQKDGRKLSIRDLTVIVDAAINAILGTDPDESKN